MTMVSARTEKLIIPTYHTGKPEKNPLFLEKRVYQGSSGAVYPHPVIEKIEQEKKDKEYNAVYLENEYLLIIILPELGGRIYRAFDKIKQRDFIYYNRVIKPALVGLTGPWISGGIEFNWPQHHRPSTFDPVDFTITENEDGSRTVWVNEVELMTRTKGMTGFTLFPGKAYLEVKGKIFNRTSFPQTFLWWANPAVKVNDAYQSIFPPDVHAVYDHGKRDVSSFPIATGTYYKVNYAPGTDISRYSNIPVPTSFMAVESQYDFVGGYEHDAQAGMLHVADHHFSPGKKQWTWGDGDFGKAWDKQLTDSDGPYIELMCGVYTDNQPDFSWLQPNEEKSFEQYFMPYSGIGEVKNATREAAIHCCVKDGILIVKIYVTAVYEKAVINIFSGETIIYKETLDLSPENIFEIQMRAGDRQSAVKLFDHSGKLLLGFTPEEEIKKEIPLPAMTMADPAEIATTEELFICGLHLEQYRHATYQPQDYYLEAVRREPSDSRSNNALGKLYLRRGQPRRAEPYLRTAVRSLTARNPNPYDGEPFYNLGICLMMQNQYDAAYNAFYKGTWNDAWQHAAYFQLARIAVRRRDYEKALYLVDKSLIKSFHSHSARHLKTAILRMLGHAKRAASFAKESVEIDPFNYGCMYELSLIDGGSSPELNMPGLFNHYAEYALDYSHAGMYAESHDLLLLYGAEQKRVSLFYYYLGWFRWMDGDHAGAKIYFEKGFASDPDYCFPSKFEEVIILEKAIELFPDDYKAQYYLGNYWFANRDYTAAVGCWEKSVAIDNGYPTPWRNLSLAYYNKLNDPQRSLQAMEKAFSLDPSDARVLMELDQLYKQMNYDPAFRLHFLEQYEYLVQGRNDLYLERLTLRNILGDFSGAAELISQWHFQPWEGGEGRVVMQFKTSHIELARMALQKGNAQQALMHLNILDNYPDNLGEGKLPGSLDNDVNYYKGIAYQHLKKDKEAGECFIKASRGSSIPEQAIFYNDPQPDVIFYQGKAWQKLGDKDKAKEIFQGLVDYGKKHMNDTIRIDYFAVSLPDLLVFDQDLDLKNSIHCHYIAGLGYLGLGEIKLSVNHLQTVLDLNRCHQGAPAHLNRTDL